MSTLERLGLALIIGTAVAYGLWQVLPPLLQWMLGPHCGLDTHWTVVVLSGHALPGTLPCPPSAGDLIGGLALAAPAGVFAGLATSWRLGSRGR